MKHYSNFGTSDGGYYVVKLPDGRITGTSREYYELYHRRAIRFEASFFADDPNRRTYWDDILKEWLDITSWRDSGYGFLPEPERKYWD